MNNKQFKSLILKETRKLFENRAVSLHIDEDLSRCRNNEKMLSDFVDYCVDFLEINIPPEVELVSNRENSKVRTTAFYDPESHLIRVYSKDRAIVDICRSIAHELTHMSQNLKGQISFPVQDVGGHIEDEANAKAGEIIKAYAKSSKERSAIYESIARKSRLTQ